MVDVPPEAVRIAVAEYHSLLADNPDPMVLSDDTLFRRVLERAAPAMAEHVAQAILAHMERHWPLERQTSHPPRRHFRIAAQVAANAFYTDEDMKRLAAEAVARGDMIVCDIPEAPREVREDDSSGR